MRIIVIRHGASEFNLRKIDEEIKFCGAYNTPLSSVGKESARNLQNNEYVKTIQKAYSSDLDRAYETALLAMPNTEIIKDKNLRERSLGKFENHPEREIREKYPEYFPNGKPNFRFDFVNRAPEGENYTDVCNRCKEFLSFFDLNSDETIGVFSHMHFIKCFTYILTGISTEDLLRIRIRNCEPIVFEGNEIGKFECVSHKLEDLFGHVRL